MNLPQLNHLDNAVGKLLQSQSEKSTSRVDLAGSLVSWALRQGHVCLDPELLKSVEFANSLSPELIEDIWQELQTSSLVGSASESTRPLILSKSGKLYFHRYWHYEQGLIQSIQDRLHTKPLSGEALDNPTLSSLGKDQKKAVHLASQSTFTMISGGPGTGKTTTVIYLLAHLVQEAKGNELKIALAAPTGKAAQRLQDSISSGLASLSWKEDIKAAIPQEATTLHRLLGYKHHSSRFVHNRELPLDFDVVVVDEASMLDLLMFSKLLDALKPETRLILLGDSHQLSSVEAGSIFGDLVTAGISNSRLGSHVIELTENFRFGNESNLFLACEQIKRGESEKAWQTISQDPADIIMRKLPSPAKLTAELEKHFSPIYREITASNDPIHAIQLLETNCLLTPLRKGSYGVEGLNETLETIIRRTHFLRRSGRYFPGQPIIITENSYTHELFNGDIGVILTNPDNPDELFAYFRDTDKKGIRRFPLSALPASESAFALTVHKSQGSEYQQVVFIIPPGETPLLSRELIYTAISRSRKSVEIWGDEQSFKNGVLKQTQRTSGILDYLA
jgi:exodeoxyribonuclease V alpha subunit